MKIDPNYQAPLDHFGEYAMAAESDNYPKTDWTQMQFRGHIDYQAFTEAYDEAMSYIPVFSCRLEEKHSGLLYHPRWVYYQDVKNRLIIEDCRHLASDPFDPMEFTTMYHSLRIRRKIDLAHEFPMTCYLVRVADDVHIFSVVYHHSAMDPSKGYLLFTKMLSGYHERITGKKPDWSKAVGMASLAKDDKYMQPVSKMAFVKEQLGDLFFRNTGGRVDNIASKEILDYREKKGRHSLRAVVDDFKLIETLLERASHNKVTFNDLMFACTRKALTEWNEEHNANSERFRFMLITSMAGRMKKKKSVGARVSALNFISEGHSETNIDEMMKYFAGIRSEQLRRGVDIHFNSTLQTIVGGLRVFPIKTRSKIVGGIMKRIPCTFYISNLGTVWPKIVDGKQTAESIVKGAGDFIIDDITSSASIARTIGLGLHTRTHNRRFYMNFICDCFRFNKEEAKTLTDMVVKEIIGAAG